MLVAVAVVAVLVIGVGVAVIVLGGDGDQAAEDRAALVAAAEDGDADEVARLLVERPELAETSTAVELGERTDLRPAEQGYVVATLELDRSTTYTIQVDADDDPPLVLLDPDDEPVEVSERLQPESAGDHTLVVATPVAIAVTVRPVLTGEVDLTQEQSIELDAPGQEVDLELEVVAGELYEVAVLEGGHYGGRVVDPETGDEVVAVPEDGTYARFEATEDATYTLELAPLDPTGEDTTQLTIDVLQLARWTAYAGEEGGAFHLEEEVEPEVIVPVLDSDRNVLTWCIDLIDGATISFAIEPSLDGSAWEMRSFSSPEEREADDPNQVYDDVGAGDSFTIETEGADATYCYDLVLLSEGTSSVDLPVTDETT